MYYLEMATPINQHLLKHIPISHNIRVTVYEEYHISYDI